MVFISGAFVLLFSTLVLSIDVVPRKIGEIDVDLAGFSGWFIHEDATNPKEKYTLLLSTFSPIPFTRDVSYAYRHIGKYLDNLGGVERRALSEELIWPREPGQCPDDVFGFPAVSQPDGFLVPFKDDGTIRVIDVRNWAQPKSYDIAKRPDDENLWFYHRVLWKDMNGDGLKDAVTNRANRDALTGETISEFLWFEHPISDPLNQKWTPHIISKNVGDTFLIEAELPAGDSTINCILTIGYFSKKLAIHWTTDPSGLWTDNSNIKTRVVDTFGKYFDLSIVDLNLDGREDLVVTVNSDTNGTLHVYEMPEDFRTGTFKNRILKSGFFPRSGLMGGGSPGTFHAFFPSKAVKDSGVKPWILMSGDDDGMAYILTPENQEKDSWKYKMTTILDEGEGNIVAKPSVADVDGDGYDDLFIPSWAAGKIYVYTYKP